MMQISSRICLAAATIAVTTLVGRAHSGEVLQVTAKAGTVEFVGAKPDGTHKGGFKKFAGTVKLDLEKPEASQVVLEIDTTSIWSDNSKLTAHLRNADFFHVDKHAKAVFKSTGIRVPTPKERKIPGNEKISHLLSGELTLLGVTKKIDLPVRIVLDDKVLSVDCIYNLDRTRFGMTYGKGKIRDAAEVTVALKILRGTGVDIR